jgi:hypothetical protein
MSRGNGILGYNYAGSGVRPKALEDKDLDVHVKPG